MADLNVCATDECQVTTVHNSLPAALEHQLTNPSSNAELKKRQKSEEMAHRQGQSMSGTIIHVK